MEGKAGKAQCGRFAPDFFEHDAIGRAQDHLGL